MRVRELALACGLLALPVRAAGDALAEGDAHYARRAEGASGARAAPAAIDQAVAAYQRAVDADAGSAEARARLIKALFFRATYCGATQDERRRLFERAREVGERGLAPLDVELRGLDGERRRAALVACPGALALQLWTAIAWGEWALARGKWAAAREGAAGRVRDLAQSVADAAPQLEEGGGLRVLGRLHDQSPKIPFLTGWVSRRKALDSLRRALEIGPANLVTQLFLAEAILDHEERRSGEARALLRGCAAAAPRPEYPVEDAHYARLCRERLARP
jgi:hypothetical protein